MWLSIRSRAGREGWSAAACREDFDFDFVRPEEPAPVPAPAVPEAAAPVGVDAEAAAAAAAAAADFEEREDFWTPETLADDDADDLRGWGFGAVPGGRGFFRGGAMLWIEINKEDEET
jgi:hypothetical protein